MAAGLTSSFQFASGADARLLPGGAGYNGLGGGMPVDMDLRYSGRFCVTGSTYSAICTGLSGAI
jgi:hypothetical protein